MNVNDKKLIYIKKAENVNVITLSSEYDNNCSEQEYVVVDDKILDFMLKDDRRVASSERTNRSHISSLYIDDDRTMEKVEAKSISAEESFFKIHDDEQEYKIKRVFNTLTILQRKRIYMKFCLGMTYTDIGLYEGKSVNSVRESCERAISKLSEYSDILLKCELKSWADLLI